MTDLETYLRDPRPTPDQVRRRVERALAGPLSPREIWLADQLLRTRVKHRDTHSSVRRSDVGRASDRRTRRAAETS